MEIHQLRYFVAIAEAGSFTAAAGSLRVAQSGLSAQLAKLERELGCRLFERVPRGIRLTAAGAGVLVLAQEALAAIGAVTEAAGEHAGLLRGEVRVGLVRGGAMTQVLDPLAELRAQHPGVSVSLVEGDGDALAAQVAEARLDLALVGYAGSGPRGLEVHTLVQEGLVAVVPRDHPLTRRPRPTLSRAAAEPLLLLAQGTGGRAAADLAVRRLGLAPRVAVESSEPATLVELARRGLGIAVLGASPAGHLADGDLVVLPLHDVTERACLGVVTRPGPPTPAALALLDLLLDS